MARSGKFWVYEFVFAKKDRDNIDEGKPIDLRRLAKQFELHTLKQIDKLVLTQQWVEICNEKHS